MRILDLFCGIGGVAEAAQMIAAEGDNASPRVVAAIDIDRSVLQPYHANHGIDVEIRTLESIQQLPDADCWWLSPPCQPYTRRGHGNAEQDRRSDALGHLITLVDRDRPRKLALENVPEFEDSNHHRMLDEVLARAGYAIRCECLCPTQFGIPMRRNRFYLRARRDGKSIEPVEPSCDRAWLREYVDEKAWTDESLQLDEETIEQYRAALDIVDIDDPSATAACFTSAYGKSIVQAGSHLRCKETGNIRRFSPEEESRLMGFRDDFEWPKDATARDKYRLLGNSLAVPVVCAVLQGLV